MSGATKLPDGSLAFQVFLSPARTISGDRTFSPVSSTLFTGRRDAVLVDAQFYREDVEALADMVLRSGKRLTAIYITHGHSDHYFGAGEIAARFPGARIVALPPVVDYIRSNKDAEMKTVDAMFGNRTVSPMAIPEPMDGHVIDLEGRPLHAIEIGQGDISPSTALHSPDLDVLVPGDIAYNGIHLMVGLSGPAEWAEWIRSVNKLAALKPRIVIAGHKQPGLPDDEPERIFGTTRTYIEDFAAAARSDPAPAAIVAAMQAKYPDFGTLTTLLFSASAAARRLTVATRNDVRPNAP